MNSTDRIELSSQQSPFNLGQQRVFNIRKKGVSCGSFSVERKDDCLSSSVKKPEKNEENSIMSQLCSEVFTENLLFRKHEEIMTKIKYIKDVEEELIINFHNISRKKTQNIKDNPLLYWIYLVVRDFEKKVTRFEIFKVFRNFLDRIIIVFSKTEVKRSRKKSFRKFSKNLPRK